MKLFCLTLVCVLLALIFSINTYAGAPKIYAVVIGIANYKDNTIPNLKYSEKDAKDFYDFLKSPFSGSIPNENISLLIGADATRGNIITSMVNMSKRCTKDDMVIFYFSGHGEADEGDNSGYLLCYDAASDNAPATAISMEEINNRLTKCQAKLKVSYVDACHAGMFASTGKGSMDADNEIIATSFMQSVSNADNGNVAFLASSAKQQSQESDKFSNGIFTYYLILGLKGDADKYQKEASGYNDGLVTVGEMVTYLNDKIPAATKYNQKPTVQGVYDEDFPLSILTSNAQIADAIAKRPERKSSTASKPAEIEKSVSDTATVYMPKDEWGGPIGMSPLFCGLCFINNYKEDILLYYVYYNGDNFSTNKLIAKGEKSCQERIPVGDYFKEIKFYFKTIDETKPIKYGTLTFTGEVGKIKTEILSTKNLYLSTSGEKRDE